MNELIPINVSFADSSFKNFTMINSSELILYLTHWQGAPLHVIFKIHHILFIHLALSMINYVK